MTASATASAPSTRRILMASLVGTSVEFYDFYIYATAAALVFGPLFFPATSPSVQLLAAYASLGVAFVARPLGAWVFGHYGDRIGRKSTLVASLMLMGGSTLAIAFLPTYETAGWAAPVMLCILRFGQGFGLGGEWGGAALLAVENAPPGWRGRFGMVPQLGAPVGFIAANGLFLILGALLTPEQFMAWGWRIPFLLSIVLVGLGLWVRLKITETPAFAAVLEEGPPPSVPMGELLRDHWKATLGGTFGAIACFAVYYLATAFALGYATTTLGINRQVFLSMQIVAILFMAVGIALSGVASDRIGAGRVLIYGTVAAIVTGLLLAPALESGSLVTIFIGLSVALFVMGFVYGPLGAWLPGLFPARVRYTGVSLAFNMAGILGGGLTPVAAQALAQYGGLIWVGLYLAVASSLSLVALLALREKG
ncbi:MFS transporter [Sphingobium boeckii]|uniref:Metabolite-proton symporter n=1 Tax=Sphingobium boeckii TaxID=1082345 RepID=A0A7W9AJN0_9SPHN|nr:MFS transporter [Sphingobium boeckii]MBB5686933.1 metabolite-proton symporter [Sphingobium boeckii]